MSAPLESSLTLYMTPPPLLLLLLLAAAAAAARRPVPLLLVLTLASTRSVDTDCAELEQKNPERQRQQHPQRQPDILQGRARL